MPKRSERHAEMANLVTIRRRTLVADGDGPWASVLAKAELLIVGAHLAKESMWILPLQIALIVGVLVAWEYVPQISGLRDTSVVFDPFFISSPSRVASRIIDLLGVRGGSSTIYQFLVPSLTATIVGVAIGMTSGALLGLILSNFERLQRVFGPFVVAANAMPRIALIPIVVIIFGPTGRSTTIVVIMVTLFLAFFNAYEGGRVVPKEMLQGAKLVGASQMQVMRYVRVPYILGWTFAAFPLAITIGLISAVTSEILTGAKGVGQVISTAQANADSSLTFAVGAILTVVAVALTALTTLLKRRVLHWWGKT